MDFFEYASVASYFVDKLWVQLIVGGLCFAVVFIFEAVALYTIAKREGYKHKWMAFIPFFNTVYVGVCAQKNRFYNLDTKKIGILTAVVEFILVVCYIIYYVARYLMADYEISVTTTNALGVSVTYFQLNDKVPANLAWAAWVYNYLYIVLNVAELIFLLLQICLLFCFFQTYACRRYVLFTFTSILFPIQGILFFVVRNNKGRNYRDFVRNEQAKQYRMYQQYHQQQNFDGNPYNQNPYNRNNNGSGYGNPSNSDGAQNGAPPEDPFSDFGNSGSSGNSGNTPFDDFN